MPPVLYRADPAAEFFTAERCHILELMNQAASPDLSIARARVAPGVTTELHALSMREVYVILEGEGRMEDGGAGTEVRPGDCIDIAAAQPQRITNTGASDLIFLCLCLPRFQPDAYRSLEP